MGELGSCAFGLLGVAGWSLSKMPADSALEAVGLLRVFGFLLTGPSSASDLFLFLGSSIALFDC
jgi:hypothetical protein